VLGIPPRDLRDTGAAAVDLWDHGTRRLLEALDRTTTPRGAAAVLLRYAGRRLARSGHPDTAVVEGVRRLATDPTREALRLEGHPPSTVLREARQHCIRAHDHRASHDALLTGRAGG
jgi:hypothetical protein